MTYSILRAASTKNEFIFSLSDYAGDPYQIEVLLSSLKGELSVIQVNDPTFNPFMKELTPLVEQALKDICSDEKALCTNENGWNFLSTNCPAGIMFE